MFKYNRILGYLLGLHLLFWADEPGDSGTVADAAADAAADLAAEQAEDELHKGLEGLDEKTISEVLKLRKENAGRRLRERDALEKLDKMEAEKKAAEEAKLLADGKLKELLTAKESEIEGLKTYKGKVEEYEEQFGKQLEAIVAKLSKDQQEMINDSGWNVAKKLDWATRLAGQKGVLNGPDSKRPDGTIVDIKNIKLEDYKGPEGRKKLGLLKTTDPNLYKSIMGLRGLKNKE